MMACYRICDRFLDQIARDGWAYTDEYNLRVVRHFLASEKKYSKEDYVRCSPCSILILKSSVLSVKCPCCGVRNMTIKHRRGGRSFRVSTWKKNYEH